MMIVTVLISGFRREVDVNCALLGFDTASGQYYLWGSKILNSRILESWPLKMGPISCPETSGRNYDYTLRNSPEEHSSQPVRRRQML